MPAKKQVRGLPTTFLEAARYFADLDVATDFVAKLRWPDGPICPECGGKEHSYLKTRRVWKCKGCRKQFSVKKGTIFEDSPIPLDKWLLAIWEIANDKNGISSRELGSKLGLTQKSAWFVNHRIRLAMQTGSFEKWSEKFDGVVEVDETYIGGKARNMHKGRRDALPDGGKFAGKTGVLGVKQRGGDVAVTIIDNTRAHHIQPKVRKRIVPGATLITDELRSYRGLDQSYQHAVINHADKYVDGQVHTNGIENFWSLLKRGLGGTYVSVRPFHLFRYLDEQVYRYNKREQSNLNRVTGVLGNIEGRRVTYKELTGRKPEPSPRPPKRKPTAWPMGPWFYPKP